MTSIPTLAAEDWRMVLATVRELRNVGVMRPDFFPQIMKRFPRFTPSSDGLAFYKFVEDYDGNGTLARRCDRSGTVYAPTSAAVKITHNESWGRPVGALADYVCLAWGRRFLQGPCVDTSCDVGTSEIDVGTPPDGAVNESYSHTITWSDLAKNPTIEGLPPGLSYNSGTGAITGTPTEAGEFTVILRSLSDVNACPITEAFNLVIAECDFGSSYIDPDSPPDGTISVLYSHDILFDDIDGDLECVGLPPGLTFNGTTGEISGTPTEEGTWFCTVFGETLTNGCPISVEFSITIGTCDAEDSRIFNLYEVGREFEHDLQYGTIDEAYSAQIGFVDIDLPMTLYTGGSGYDFPTGLTFDGDTGLISGTPTECGEFLFEIHGDSETNECKVSKFFRLLIQCDCPDPDDYTGLVAWLVDSGGASSSESLDENVPFNDVLPTSNATFNTSPPIVSNLPIGLTWDPNTGEIDGIPDTAGVYVTVFYGKVTSGDHADCLIIHTRTYTVS